MLTTQRAIFAALTAVRPELATLKDVQSIERPTAYEFQLVRESGVEAITLTEEELRSFWAEMETE